jgi:L-ascorbate metabolism protein UlaG (beta-lactamase superfamily)
MKPGSTFNTIFQYLFRGSKERMPAQPLPVAPLAGSIRKPSPAGLRFVWLGHSSVFLELNGKKMLFDPVFSERASFLSWLGPKRFQPAPLRASDLPQLDAVLISHNHYDHMDKSTIIQLAGTSRSFHVPLGLSPLLESWGIPQSKIHEYAWWDERETNGIMIAATPARHFSGRGLFDRNRTLWCSWAVSAGGSRIFFSGDTGITARFREIGEKYGPFDVTFVKMAAYNENWPDIHLNPEQAVEAHRELRGKTLVPIHWATFDLALHSWHEPIERLVKAAAREKVRTVMPMMGEFADPDHYVNEYWWRPLVQSKKESDPDQSETKLF